ncbi:MAG: zinc-ribbon domain-containing protein [Sedimentisphaerales bacterium]|nr:zinc-ribbon domain-containing protein [Sedimentisphaerales bacterium]
MTKRISPERKTAYYLGGGEPEKVIMIKCRSCGKLNEEDSKFCQECGKPL